MSFFDEQESRRIFGRRKQGKMATKKKPVEKTFTASEIEALINEFKEEQNLCIDGIRIATLFIAKKIRKQNPKLYEKWEITYNGGTNYQARVVPDVYGNPIFLDTDGEGAYEKDITLIRRLQTAEEGLAEINRKNKN